MEDQRYMRGRIRVREAGERLDFWSQSPSPLGNLTIDWRRMNPALVRDFFGLILVGDQLVKDI
jgi:hypothetical protein